MTSPQPPAEPTHSHPFRRVRRAVLCAAVAVAAWGTPDAARAQGEAFDNFVPVTDAVLQDPDPADWLHWRRTLDAWGHSPLDEITPDNAHELRLVWSWALAEGSQQTTPLVYAGVMYIANPGERVQALDARTGELLWEYRRPRTPTDAGTPPPNLQHRNLAIYQDRIYLNTSDGHVVALDARTGGEVWDADVGGAAGFEFTSGSIIADGRVVSGLTGCERYRDDTCYIVALDAGTGRELWRTSTVARPGERGGDSWGDLPVMFRAGSDAWIPRQLRPARADALLRHGAGQALGARRARHRRVGALHQLDAGPRPADRRAEVVLPAPAGRVARHGRGLRADPRRLRRPAVRLHHGQDRRPVGARPRDRPVPRRPRSSATRRSSTSTPRAAKPSTARA